MKQPNILFIMCDQFRFDCISALGNPVIKTPNLDRLARRGTSFTNAYSTCPICVPARYTLHTGCEPGNTLVFNHPNSFVDEKENVCPTQGMEARCSDYLPRRLRSLGYRTFGVGKFHTLPDVHEDLGYDTQVVCEEVWPDQETRDQDDYCIFLKEHPEFGYIEQPHGERTEMLYRPQLRQLPQELTVEWFATSKTLELMEDTDDRPFFGLVSYLDPHPPCAPPVPYNRMYNPDIIPDPVNGDISADLADPVIPIYNYGLWADDATASGWRAFKARYYGEISFIDTCIGKLLDAVEARPDADDTMICFLADHGEMAGDHHGCGKGSFFESSAKVPFIVSWPNSSIEANKRSQLLVSLADFYALATRAAGHCDKKDGIDIMAALTDPAAGREYLAGLFDEPGTIDFKIMIRKDDFKYIFIANGGKELLFNVKTDPDELHDLSQDNSNMLCHLRQIAKRHCMEHESLAPALDTSGALQAFELSVSFPRRIHQLDFSMGLNDFMVSVENKEHFISAT